MNEERQKIACVIYHNTGQTNNNISGAMGTISQLNIHVIMHCNMNLAIAAVHKYSINHIICQLHVIFAM